MPHSTSLPRTQLGFLTCLLVTLTEVMSIFWPRSIISQGVVLKSVDENVCTSPSKAHQAGWLYQPGQEQGKNSLWKHAFLLMHTAAYSIFIFVQIASLHDAFENASTLCKHLYKRIFTMNFVVGENQPQVNHFDAVNRIMP